MHFDGRGKNLDAKLVHHQNSPLHLPWLLIVSEDIGEDSWNIRDWWGFIVTKILTVAHNSLQHHPGGQKSPVNCRLFIFVKETAAESDTACHHQWLPVLLYTITGACELYNCSHLSPVVVPWPDTCYVHIWCKDEYNILLPYILNLFVTQPDIWSLCIQLFCKNNLFSKEF